MADKRITQLQLRGSVSDDCNFPVDDGTQSYRVTALQIKNYILGAGVILRSMIEPNERFPIGGTVDMATDIVPDGHLECDGALISRTTYAPLFAKIGTRHGSGDGSTTFALPDYRGRFKRGWSHGQTRDPDKATRTAMATGGATGDNVGSVQAEAYLSHTHTQSSHFHTQQVPAGGGGGIASGQASSYTGAVSSYLTTNSATAVNLNSGGSETRPLNAGVMVVIKY